MVTRAPLSRSSAAASSAARTAPARQLLAEAQAVHLGELGRLAQGQDILGIQGARQLDSRPTLLLLVGQPHRARDLIRDLDDHCHRSNIPELRSNTRPTPRPPAAALAIRQFPAQPHLARAHRVVPARCHPFFETARRNTRGASDPVAPITQTLQNLWTKVDPRGLSSDDEEQESQAPADHGAKGGGALDETSSGARGGGAIPLKPEDRGAPEGSASDHLTIGDGNKMAAVLAGDDRALQQIQEGEHLMRQIGTFYDVGVREICPPVGIAENVQQGEWLKAGVGVGMAVGGGGKLLDAASGVAKGLSAATRGGRLGNAATRAHVDDVAAEFESRGWTITRGGQRGPEEYLPGPGGARKGSSYPDITATKNGRTLRANTIDTYADGVTATTREAANAVRIREQTPGDHLLLIPKPKP